jgi:carbon-monoxide dehydrogenase medium subunit
LLRQYRGKARIIAGGTDLVVRMKQKLMTPEYVVDITGIPGLNGIEYNGKSGLKVGALCTHDDIVFSPVIKDKFPLIAQAAGTIGSVQLRNLGTVGGNLCNAAPSADLAPALIGLDARARIYGSAGERVIELKDFFTGPGETVLEPDEILVGVEVPIPPPHSAAIYIKHGPRKAMDIAVVGVAVVLCLNGEDSTCSDIRIVLGAVAPTPIRASMAEETVRGKKLGTEVVAEAARIAATETKPISDVRSSVTYRQKMVEVLTRRAIQQALEQARKIQ